MRIILIIALRNSTTLSVNYKSSPRPVRSCRNVAALPMLCGGHPPGLSEPRFLAAHDQARTARHSITDLGNACCQRHCQKTHAGKAVAIYQNHLHLCLAEWVV